MTCDDERRRPLVGRGCALLPKPAGSKADKVYSRSEVLEAANPSLAPTSGIVRVRTIGVNSGDQHAG